MNSLARIATTALCLALVLSARPAVAEVVVVVSARSPVRALNKDQVADIFLGRMRRFPDGATAQPIDQAEGSPARDAFYREYAERSHAQIKAHWSKIVFTGRGQPPAAVSDPEELKQRIAANPAAIGYLDRSQLDASVRALP